jgi:hypothetical protein
MRFQARPDCLLSNGRVSPLTKFPSQSARLPGNKQTHRRSIGRAFASFRPFSSRLVQLRRRVGGGNRALAPAILVTAPCWRRRGRVSLIRGVRVLTRTRRSGERARRSASMHKRTFEIICRVVRTVRRLLPVLSRVPSAFRRVQPAARPPALSRSVAAAFVGNVRIDGS